jgi:hypothetical protein
VNVVTDVVVRVVGTTVVTREVDIVVVVVSDVVMLKGKIRLLTIARRNCQASHIGD